MALPPEFNWAHSNILRQLPIKDQGHLGIWWAVVTPLTTKYQCKSSSTWFDDSDLGEDYITSFGITLAYAQNNGVTLESHYPYRAHVFQRMVPPEVPRVFVHNSKTAAGWDAITKAIVKMPAGRCFDSYKGEGIFSVRENIEDEGVVPHGILITGYGVENGTRYYNVRNSYGASWGDRGYGKLDADLIESVVYPGNLTLHYISRSHP